jgi:hypothetical protein
MRNTAKGAAEKAVLMGFHAHLGHKPLKIRPRWKFIWSERTKGDFEESPLIANGTLTGKK